MRLASTDIRVSDYQLFDLHVVSGHADQSLDGRWEPGGCNDRPMALLASQCQAVCRNRDLLAIQPAILDLDQAVGERRIDGLLDMGEVPFAVLTHGEHCAQFRDGIFEFREGWLARCVAHGPGARVFVAQCGHQPAEVKEPLVLKTAHRFCVQLLGLRFEHPVLGDTSSGGHGCLTSRKPRSVGVLGFQRLERFRRLSETAGFQQFASGVQLDLGKRIAVRLDVRAHLLGFGQQPLGQFRVADADGKHTGAKPIIRFGLIHNQLQQTPRRLRAQFVPRQQFALSAGQRGCDSPLVGARHLPAGPAQRQVSFGKARIGGVDPCDHALLQLRHAIQLVLPLLQANGSRLVVELHIVQRNCCTGEIPDAGVLVRFAGRLAPCCLGRLECLHRCQFFRRKPGNPVRFKGRYLPRFSRRR